MLVAALTVEAAAAVAAVFVAVAALVAASGASGRPAPLRRSRPGSADTWKHLGRPSWRTAGSQCSIGGDCYVSEETTSTRVSEVMAWRNRGTNLANLDE